MTAGRRDLAVGLLLLLLGLGWCAVELRDLPDDLGRDAEEVVDLPLRDFRDAGYLPASDLLDGENPYELDDYLARHPGHLEFNLYSPHWFLVVGPLALLPYGAAVVAWLVVLAAAAAVLGRLALWSARLPSDLGWQLGATGVVLTSAPGKDAVFNGQPAIVLTAALVAAVAAAWRRPVIAGVLLAIAAMKVQHGAVAAVLLAVGWGRWRLAGAATAAAIALAAIPLVVLSANAGGVGDLVGSMLENLEASDRIYAEQTTGLDLVRIDVLNWPAKLLDVAPSGGVQTATTVGLVGLGVVLARRAGDPVDADGRPTALTTAIVGVLSAAALFHPLYDGVLLLVPAVVAWSALVRREPQARRPAWWVLAVAATVPLVNYHPVERALDAVAVPVAVQRSLGSIALTVAVVALSVVVLRPEPRS